MLEDLALTPEADADAGAWASAIGARVFPGDRRWGQMLAARLCLVHDDVLAFLLDTATEVTARVRLRLSVEKGRPVKWPRIESETELMAVGSARPMEDAARIAWVELIDWLVGDFGFDRMEAYQLLTHAGRLRVGNMVDPLYSVVAKIERRFLPEREEG